VAELSGSWMMRAPAKVNLYLDVGTVRPDGYHQVVTVLQSLSLHDTLTFSTADSLEVICRPDLGITPESNLVHKAAVMLSETVGVQPKVRIEIDKCIPHGAGLGGGSSDAATALLGLARLWEIDSANPVLLGVSKALGSDVPFFLEGGTALFGGRGEELEISLPTPRLDVALVKPAASISTASAYRALQNFGPSPGSDLGTLIGACERNNAQEVAAAIHNTFTPVVTELCEEAREVLSFCADQVGVHGCAVSGSGSAIFAVCADGQAARLVAQNAQNRGWWSRATVTTPSAGHFSDDAYREIS